MRSCSVLFLLLATSAHGDIWLATSKGVWRTVDGVPVLQSKLGDTIAIDGSTQPPDPDPDPDPTLLADKVAQWADAVNDPGARSALSSIYKLSAENNATWQGALDTIVALRRTIFLGTTKREEWAAVFVKIDAAVQIAPHTDATLLEVSEGLGRAQGSSEEAPIGGGQINWVKFIACIVGIFAPAEGDSAKIDPTPMLPSAVMTNPPKIGALRRPPLFSVVKP